MSRNFYFFILAFTFNLSHYVPSSLASPIIGGKKDIHFERWYHVSVHEHKIIDGYEYLCGGTIVRPTVVLTAAQCFIERGPNGRITDFNPRDHPVKVVGGINTINGDGIESNVFKIFISSDYLSTPYYQADVAILKLAHNILGNIQHLTIGRSFLDMEASFCGFGYFEGSPNSQGIFQITTRFSSINRCLDVVVTDIVRESPSRTYNIIHAMGGEEPYSACPGDTGAGLIRNNQIIGILTGNLRDCVRRGEPLKFTEVYQYEPMIEAAARKTVPPHMFAL